MNKPTLVPTHHVHEGAHAQTLASTQVRYSPMLDRGEPHLFSPAHRNISLASSRSLQNKPVLFAPFVLCQIFKCV